MLRGCLIHPVAPLLSFLAPLFRPFFSPVRAAPDVAILQRKPLKSCDFCAALRTAPAAGEFFPLLSGLKQGAREAMIALTVAGPVPDGLTPLNLTDTTPPRSNRQEAGRRAPGLRGTAVARHLGEAA